MTNPTSEGNYNPLESASARATRLNGTSNSSNSSGNNNAYLSAIQSLLSQNQQVQQNQLYQQQAQQNQLMYLQQGQVKKAAQQQKDAQVISSEVASDSYVSLLKQMMSLSGRNAALNDRMFS